VGRTFGAEGVDGTRPIGVRRAFPSKRDLLDSREPRPAPDASAPTLVASRFARLAPLLFFVTYLNASVLLFAYGPWHWPLRDGTALYVFLTFAHCSIILGYVSACFGTPTRYVGRIRPTSLVHASVLLNLILYVPTVLWLTHGQVNIEQSVLDPGATYRGFQEASSGPHETYAISYVRTVLAAPLALAMTLVPFYWERLNRIWKALGLLTILGYLAQFLLTGRNKGLADLLMLAPWILAMRTWSGKLRLRLKHWVAFGLLGGAVLAGFLVFLTRNVIGRSTVDVDTSDYVPILGGLYSDDDNFVIANTPESMRTAIRNLSFDHGHGYFALHMALHQPFESAFPVGHSYVLQTLELRFTGKNSLADHSYTSRLDSAGLWDEHEFWHTTYTWFASDVSFPGVIVLLFFFGRYFAKAWLDTLNGDNPYAAAMFITFVTMAYYFPTNNIVLGFPEAYVAFWCTLIAWLSTRHTGPGLVSRFLTRRTALLPQRPRFSADR
jgi:hypothetical protein